MHILYNYIRFYVANKLIRWKSEGFRNYWTQREISLYDKNAMTAFRVRIDTSLVYYVIMCVSNLGFVIMSVIGHFTNYWKIPGFCV